MNAYRILLLLSWFTAFGRVETAFAEQPDMEPLRKAFAEAAGRDFDIVKDVLHERPAARGGETYWLVHVKPKRSGHYALKYTYRFTHGRSHPEEGENEIFIRVGERNGGRDHANQSLSSVCMGDTVIVPIRMDRMAGHRFSLKSDYEDGKNIGRRLRPADRGEDISGDAPADNPLEEHLRCLGTQHSVALSRAATGPETVTYSAVFEAKSAGRFNLAVSSRPLGQADAGGGIPVIIVNPGTPVTALAYHQNTIHYSDDKKFSAHSGHQFPTNLLILQPGDVFVLDYATRTQRGKAGDKEEDPGEKPPFFIHRLPFAVDRDVSYNEWLADHLPPEE